MPVVAHLFQRSFAVEFLLQPTQGFFYGFTFFNFYFAQLNSHPLYIILPAFAPHHGSPNRADQNAKNAKNCQ